MDNQMEQRVVYFSRMPRDHGEDQIKKVFEPFGPVEDVVIFKTSVAATVSKGCGYVVMGSYEAAVAAMTGLDGKKLHPEDESTLVVKWKRMTPGFVATLPAPDAGSRAPPSSVVPNPAAIPRGCAVDAFKLYIGNVPLHCTEDDLYPLLRPHGNVVECAIMRNKSTQGSQGCAFVWFETGAQAEAAMRALNLQHCLNDPTGQQKGPLLVRRARMRQAVDAGNGDMGGSGALSMGVSRMGSALGTASYVSSTDSRHFASTDAFLVGSNHAAATAAAGGLPVLSVSQPGTSTIIQQAQPSGQVLVLGNGAQGGMYGNQVLSSSANLFDSHGNLLDNRMGSLVTANHQEHADRLAEVIAGLQAAQISQINNNPTAVSYAPAGVTSFQPHGMASSTNVSGMQVQGLTYAGGGQGAGGRQLWTQPVMGSTVVPATFGGPGSYSMNAPLSAPNSHTFLVSGNNQSQVSITPQQHYASLQQPIEMMGGNVMAAQGNLQNISLAGASPNYNTAPVTVLYSLQNQYGQAIPLNQTALAVQQQGGHINLQQAYPGSVDALTNQQLISRNQTGLAGPQMSAGSMMAHRPSMGGNAQPQHVTSGAYIKTAMSPQQPMSAPVASVPVTPITAAAGNAQPCHITLSVTAMQMPLVQRMLSDLQDLTGSQIALQPQDHGSGSCLVHVTGTPTQIQEAHLLISELLK